MIWIWAVVVAVALIGLCWWAWRLHQETRRIGGARALTRMAEQAAWMLAGDLRGLYGANNIVTDLNTVGTNDERHVYGWPDFMMTAPKIDTAALAGPPPDVGVQTKPDLSWIEFTGSRCTPGSSVPLRRGTSSARTPTIDQVLRAAVLPQLQRQVKHLHEEIMGLDERIRENIVEVERTGGSYGRNQILERLVGRRNLLYGTRAKLMQHWDDIAKELTVSTDGESTVTVSTDGRLTPALMRGAGMLYSPRNHFAMGP